MPVKFNKNDEQLLFHFYSKICSSYPINFLLCSKDEMMFKKQFIESEDKTFLIAENL